jgi:PAS domain S-box-containing protein
MDAMFAEALITNMPDAVVYSDRDGTIRFWNGGATRMFDHTTAEVVGQSLDLIIPEGLRGVRSGGRGDYQ